MFSLPGLMRSIGKLVAKWSLADLDRASYDRIISVYKHSFWSLACRSISILHRFDGLERHPDEGLDR